MSDHKTTRRDLLKLVGAASASAVVPGVAGVRTARAAQMQKPSVTYAGYPYDRVAPLVKGEVPVAACDLTYEPDKIGNLNTHVFSGPQTREVTEIGLHPFMLAWANEGFRDYMLLPVFPLRVFRHKSIFIRTDRGISKPEDLKGKKVATPGYSTTSLTWIRGILQHEYGVAPGDVTWYVSAEDSTAADTGGPSKQENVIPKSVNVLSGPAGKDESEMLADGDVDALLHATEPLCYQEGHPKVARLFSDFRSTERAYFEKTGIFPIMHAVAVRKKTIEQYPWLTGALFVAFSKAKQVAFEKMRSLGWALNSLPWFAKELEETRALMGDNFWPYGLEPNRKALEALFAYSHEQGLCKRKIDVEEMFHPSTRGFSES